jgi:mono/diheme cytochrome c family protein
MRKLFRFLAVIVILVGCFALYIQLAYQKKFAGIPTPEIKASRDSAVIARGKYLVYGPAHCANCHTDINHVADVDAGKEIALSGGFEFTTPVAIFRSRNITSDKETGIGSLTDGQIARTMRYNVNHNDEALAPFMPFQEMSEEDMIAVISYIRTLPPVRNVVPPSDFNFLGKIVKTFILKPSFPEHKPVYSVQRDTTAEYGRYMAHYVANCYGCHTDRDMKTGAFIGAPFAGGLTMEPSPETKGYGFITPNITPDEQTGRMAGWNEEIFIKRLKGGRIHAASPMPWGPFSRMDESDLKAIYRYLLTVTPVNKKIDKIVYAPGEKMPEGD